MPFQTENKEFKCSFLLVSTIIMTGSNQYDFINQNECQVEEIALLLHILVVTDSNLGWNTDYSV
jgi:hypothetical protein